MITLENTRHQQQVSSCPGSEVNFHFELAEFMFNRRNPVGRNFNSIILLFGNDLFDQVPATSQNQRDL